MSDKKLKYVVSSTVKNKANNQTSFSLKSGALKTLGLTPENLLEMRLPKPNVKKVLSDIKRGKKKK